MTLSAGSIAFAILVLAGEGILEAQEGGRFRIPLTAGVDVGVDTNLTSTAVAPPRDTTAQVFVQIEPSLRIGPATATGRVSAMKAYYREYSGLGSLETDDALRVDVRLRRITAYVSGSYLRTRDPFGPEFDVRAERSQRSAEAGAHVRLTGKSSVAIGVRKDAVEFEPGVVLAGTELRQALNRSGESVTLSLRNAVTPLTSIVVVASAQRDAFDYVPERDTTSLRMRAGFDFKAGALLQGAALFGIRQMTFGPAAESHSDGAVTSIDLGYQLTDSILCAFRAESDFIPSFFVTQRYYRATRVGGAVTKRIGRTLTAAGEVTRQRTDYDVDAIPMHPADDGSVTGVLKTVTRLRTSVGYAIRRGTDLRLVGDYHWLQSVTGREFPRVRVLSSIAHRF